MEEKEIEQGKESILLDIGIGMIGFALLIQLPLLFVSETLLKQSVGLWIGVAIGFSMFVHMKRSIEDALDIGEYDAASYMKRKSMLRLSIVILAFFVLAYFQIGSVLTAFIGAMGLKISVYMQPYIYKVRRNLRKGG